VGAQLVLCMLKFTEKEAFASTTAAAVLDSGHPCIQGQASTEPAVAEWLAYLSMSFQQSARACCLSRCRHQGPLYVQKPFYPEGRELAHVYLLHPPGGLVSGDQLRISVDVEAQAQVLITTPGAGRVYRARLDRTLQQQHIHLKVAAGASLEWLPLETIAYPGANAKLNVNVDLATGGHYIGWDITSLGLPANNLAFDHGALQQRLVISQEGEPVLIECQRLGDGFNALMQAKAGFDGFPITGLMVAGPFVDGVPEDAMMRLRACMTLGDETAIAGVSLVHQFLVLRYLGESSEQARKVFTVCWAVLRPLLLNRQACAPRIWST
jgi:urease accessory protein